MLSAPMVSGDWAAVPVISAMGTGNKLHPEGFFVADIAQTSMCPLARVMRKELKKRGLENVRVVCSREAPQKPRAEKKRVEAKAAPVRQKDVPGSISFVPAAAGLVLAGAVVRALLGLEG